MSEYGFWKVAAWVVGVPIGLGLSLLGLLIILSPQMVEPSRDLQRPANLRRRICADARLCRIDRSELDGVGGHITSRSGARAKARMGGRREKAEGIKRLTGEQSATGIGGRRPYRSWTGARGRRVPLHREMGALTEPASSSTVAPASVKQAGAIAIAGCQCPRTDIKAWCCGFATDKTYVARQNRGSFNQRVVV
jgi:hypothetical protein